MPKRPLIILFAKAPAAGRVKTRLLPLLSPDQTVELHRAMVLDTLETLQRLRHIADIELHTDLPTNDWAVFPFPRRLQPDGGLGQRLWVTMARALGEGHARVLILGSDSPGLPAAHVTGLLESTADVKLGPTEDGGFYGISARRVTPEMFDGIRWSTAHTLADTRVALQRIGLSVETGEDWFDVDEPGDLIRLTTMGCAGLHLTSWLDTFYQGGSRPNRGIANQGQPAQQDSFFTSR
ncbi:MAG: TIGR04282 family arsenosugar biosynthesis glycosyltransferase [Acidobacteria bacterium]|nr:TIGR04282 family arsenosugar biosynthesis glycosyltransferase [Acidobacteriota bacterium]